MTDLTGRRSPNLSFEVRGTPAPQGSKTAGVSVKTGKAFVRESSARVRPWRQDVVAMAMQAMSAGGRGWRSLKGPIVVVIEFYMPRPTTHPKTKRTVPDVSPDVDKLIRSTLDGLTAAGVYRDDGQVVDVHVRERYGVHEEALGHDWEMQGVGARIDVLELDPGDTWADRPLWESIAGLYSGRTIVPTLVPSPFGLARLPENFERLVLDASESDSRGVALLARADRLITKGKAVGLMLVDGRDRLMGVPGAPLTPFQLALEAAAVTYLEDEFAFGVVAAASPDAVVGQSAREAVLA